MNISEMGGGTPIGLLRKDVVDKQVQQMSPQQMKQYMCDMNNRQYDNRQHDNRQHVNRQHDDDAIDALINKINTDTDEYVPKNANKKNVNKKNANKKNANKKNANNKNANEKNTNKKKNVNKTDVNETNINETDTDEEEDTENNTVEKSVKKSKFNLSFITSLILPEFIKDIILIWVIFVILSQNFIKQIIGKYVKHINPNDDGVVSFIGVAMYGLIFAVLFGLIKFLLKILL